MINLINANASVVAVTNTATLIADLLDTAAGADQQVPAGLKGIALNPEDGDIRVLWDGNTPTTAKGYLLKRGLWYYLPYAIVDQLKLIRTGSANVQVGIMLGDQAQLPAIVGVAGEVGLNTAIQAYNSSDGTNQSSVLSTFFRPTDSLPFDKELSSSTTPQQLIAATASKYIELVRVTISTDTAQWIRLEDNTGTPVVIVPKIYLPANGTVTIVFPYLRRVPLAKDLNVDCGGSVGNITVSGDYRVVS